MTLIPYYELEQKRIKENKDEQKSKRKVKDMRLLFLVIEIKTNGLNINIYQ